MGTRTDSDGQVPERADSVEPLIKKHGGYRNLKSFKLAQLVYDLTALFVEQFVDARSRTRDQMVQAARSGVQNIGEGSQFSATSSKLELSLTNAARSSQEELRLDYEDYLRQHGYPQWGPRHPALMRFKAQRCSTVADVLSWAESEEVRAVSLIHQPGTPAWAKTSGSGSPCRSVLLANAALSLLNISSYLLDKQIQAQAEAFVSEGGFSERMYRVRSQRRRSG
ncbi:MAG: four helix bundle protein [Armatimonadetes bacterium]|nr:four helix bundle protein [Armatimonadota bacterium]